MSVEAVLSRRAKWHTLVGDVRETLRSVPDGCAQTCVTSPPYFGLRDYGAAGQIGQEPTPREFVDALVAVMREVRRVLADDGTLWLNLGDSYAGSWGNQGRKEGRGTQRPINGPMIQDFGTRARAHAEECDMGEDCMCGAAVPASPKYPQKQSNTGKVPDGWKPKDLFGVPWRVAFALQDDGWFLRSDIVWSKPNPMPESVADRPTRAHEYVFLLTKCPRYFYDADAIREPLVKGADGSRFDVGKTGVNGAGRVGAGPREDNPAGRNARDVWTIAPEPFAEAHFATMPPELARRCILAGSRKGDVVLDPFGGAATTAYAALREGRRALLCELNPEYVDIQRRRLAVFDVDAVSPIAANAADFGPLFGGAP